MKKIKYKNFKIRHRIFLLTFVIIIPFTLISFFLLSRYSDAGPEVTGKRVNGLQYTQHMLRIAKLLQEHRGLTFGFLDGNHAFGQELDGKKNEVFDAVAGTDSFLVSFDKGDDVIYSGWDVLKEKILGLTSVKYTSKSRAFQQHTGVIEDLFFEVRKTAGLTGIVGSENNSMLVELATRDLPAIAEGLGKTRALASVAGTMNYEKDELHGYMKRVAAHIDEADKLVEYVSVQEPEFYEKHGKEYSGVKKVIHEKLAYLEQNVAGQRGVSVRGQAVFSEMSEAVNAVYKFNENVFLYIQQKLEARDEEVQLQYNSLIVILSGSLIIFVILGRFITRSITVPLENAVYLSKVISAGDLRQEIEVNDHSETGTLLNAMNTMRLEIHNIIGQLLLSAEKMNLISGIMKKDAVGYSDDAGVMVEFAEETAMNAVEMISSVDSVSANTRAQAENAVKINDMVESLDRSIKDITVSMTDLASVASASAEEVKKGNTSIREATDAIAEVNGISGEIKKIIGGITEIAQQTNLLALNAAIEAARAGEAGQGFAVVAEEISKLSAKTAASVKSIGDLILRSKQAADDTSEKVGGVVKILAGQIAAMDKIGEMTRVVLSALEVQSRNTGESAERVGELTGIIEKVNKVSGDQLNQLQEISISLQSVSDQSKRISEGAREISVTSDNLESIINILKRSIRNFKVDENALITWNDSFLVGVPKLDQQHKRLFDMMQNIYDCMQGKECIADIAKLIEDLSMYATTHLRDEEKFLEEIGYPEMEEHKLMHVKMEGRIIEFSRMYEKEGDLVVYDILQFLANWLIFHIKEEDQKYSEYFAARK